MANEASIHSKLRFNRDGLLVKVKGFNSSIKNFILEFTRFFKELKMDNKEKKLQMYKESYLREIMNIDYCSPLDQALKYLYPLIYDEYMLPEDELTAMKSKHYEKEDIARFIEVYLDQSKYEWLIQGNISQQEAFEIAKSTQDLMQKKSLATDKTPVVRIVNIKKRSISYMIKTLNDEENQNSAIISYFQLGKLSIEEMSIAKVLENYLSERFFDQLRTKQQLGYLVSMQYSGHRKIDCFTAQVQSPNKSPEYISRMITEFLKDNHEAISNITEEEFQKHVNSLLNMLKAKDLKLSSEVSRNFIEIKYKDYCFDVCEKQIEILEKLNKLDFITFYEKHFIKDFRRLDIEMVSQDREEENDKEEVENDEYYKQTFSLLRKKIKSPNEFKRSNFLYPDYLITMN